MASWVGTSGWESGSLQKTPHSHPQSHSLCLWLLLFHTFYQQYSWTQYVFKHSILIQDFKIYSHRHWNQTGHLVQTHHSTNTETQVQNILNDPSDILILISSHLLINKWKISALVSVTYYGIFFDHYLKFSFHCLGYWKFCLLLNNTKTSSIYSNASIFLLSMTSSQSFKKRRSLCWLLPPLYLKIIMEFENM